MLDAFNEATAAYVVRYSLKKMSQHQKEGIANDRYPVFARQSRRPGIGLAALSEIASIVLQHELVDKHGDAPYSLRHGQKIYPLGRYLRAGLRKEVGVGENASPYTLEIQKQQLQALRDIAWESGVTLASLIKEKYGPLEERLIYLQKLMSQKHIKLRESL